MKKKWLGAVLGSLVLLSLPASGITGWDMVDTFQSMGGPAGTATVHSWVTPMVTAAGYRYFYEITGSSVNVNWFSVELLPDPGLMGGKGTTPTTGGQNPIIWDFMDDPASSIAALFQSQITSPNGHSYIMYFESLNSPIEGEAMATGIKSGQYYSLGGTVFTPVPEPMTLGLLALGAGLLALRRK